MYVDGCLFFAPNEEDIMSEINKLKERTFDLNIKDDVTKFLGVFFKQNENAWTIALIQMDLIGQIISCTV